jgi:hypothetical protein
MKKKLEAESITAVLENEDQKKKINEQTQCTTCQRRRSIERENMK